VIRLWVCDACSQPCVLLFHSNRNFKGSHCCLSLYVHTEKRDTPVQAVIR
jgi:hypothetical protein